MTVLLQHKYYPDIICSETKCDTLSKKSVNNSQLWFLNSWWYMSVCRRVNFWLLKTLFCLSNNITTMYGMYYTYKRSSKNALFGSPKNKQQQIGLFRVTFSTFTKLIYFICSRSQKANGDFNAGMSQRSGLYLVVEIVFLLCLDN